MDIVIEDKIIGVEFERGGKVYHFKNKYELPVKVGATVVCKVGTGGTSTAKVVYIQDMTIQEKRKGIRYKNIVEINGLKINQEQLQVGNTYICDVRPWRNQWSNDGEYKYQWSDSIETCLYDITENITIGSIVEYQDTKAKVVNLRQIVNSKTLKLKKVKCKPQKISFLNKIMKMINN